MRSLLFVLPFVLLASTASADTFVDVTSRYVQSCDCEVTGDCLCQLGTCDCPHCYKTHYAAAQDSGDLLVLVTADWCQYCPAAKAALDASGKPYALVDADTPLGKRIARTGSVPELIHYTRQGGTWKATRTNSVQAYLDPRSASATVFRGSARGGFRLFGGCGIGGCR